MADALGRPEDEVEAVRLAGRLHDIGMLLISDRVVNREGRLTPEEFDQVRNHPLVSHQGLAGKALDPAVCSALSRVIGRGRTLEFVLDPA